MKTLILTGLCLAVCAALATGCGGGKTAENKGAGGPAKDDTLRLPVPDDFKAKSAPDLTDADLIAKGKEIYDNPSKGNCGSCHGDGGKADGVLAPTFQDPPVADLTSEAMHNAISDQYIFWRIKEPEKSKAVKTSGMLGYAQGSDEEIWAMVAYVRSLKGK
jgi:mono/diheme cytochrome c family protein